jgi:peptide/nickel transport system substrate-binding protein
LRLEFKLRKGVMFPAKTGVTAARELVAEDVVYSFQRMNASPKRIANFFAAVDRVEAPDRSTVVFCGLQLSPVHRYRKARSIVSEMVGPVFQ